MKIKICLIFVLLIIFTAFTSQKSLSSKDKLKEKINLVTSNWNTLSSEADMSFENIKSWLPDRGIRGRYEIVKKYLGKSMLENIVGEKVFLEGPHEEKINFSSLKTFGRYSPEFLFKLYKQLETLFEDETLVKVIKPLYDSQLKNLLRVYFLSYEVAANKQELVDGYLAAISNEFDTTSPSKHVFLSQPSRFLLETFDDFADSLDSQYDIYEGSTCPGFWVRRSIDGTADEFYDLLVLTLKTFDQDFINSP